MYEDRLDGRIDLSLFERKSGEYRQEQARITAEINGLGTADGQYMDAGIRLLELTRNMHRLFEKQQAAEKRRLLDFVVSNSVWKEGKSARDWRRPARKRPKSKLAPQECGFATFSLKIPEGFWAHRTPQQDGEGRGIVFW